LKGWSGIGFVVQAYQKRCPHDIDYLIDLARRSRRRLMVRLVKGAYWDSEIKRAQLDGLAGYPVYTRKVYTDVSYLACARKLLEVPDAIYPQFATHNAQTLASIYQLATSVGGSYYSGQYEFQCLHGMGEPLYAQVTGAIADGKLARPCRVYAPVGNHETLLAYLVRRLLENGANTSFVNRIGDPSVPVAELVADPVEEVMQIANQEGRLGAPHPKIPLPAHLLAQGPQGRANSSGVNLAHEQQLASLAAALLSSTTQHWLAAPADVPLPADPAQTEGWAAMRNPAELSDTVGWVREASAADAQAAAERAARAAPIWAGTPPAARGDVLQRAADLLEQRSQVLMGLIVREAGKTLPNAVAEIREAVDFLRYYGAMVADQFDNARERPLGVILAISPWNFPLAIFCGQVAAALAAGNTVLAKPAEQTPLTAAAMVAILHEAGVPRDALQFVPGQGETVGAALVAHPQVAGVMFTGSTEVARIIARQLAQRLSPAGQPIPLIAETGGQNAMIVDSSALAEQVVGDVLTSAFDSAGQRCSALRLLCVQEDVAERQLTMLRDALHEWSLGNPDRQSTDVGPVIDEEARAQIEAHIRQMQDAGQKVTRVQRADGALNGHFVAPAIIEIDSAQRLTREVFGPVLHVIRFQRDQLDALVDDINATGYGLTFGVHSRIDETIDRLTRRIHAGNVYVNRNVVGAVVGVQPFGGMGLSGTGPKAGGPLYLYRLVQGQPNTALAALPRSEQSAPAPQLLASLQTTVIAGVEQSGRICAEALAASRLGTSLLLTGPTGESNRYRLLPRGAVWALPRTPLGLVHQVAAALATGNPCHVVLPAQDNGCAAAWHALRAAAGDAGTAWLHSADSASLEDAAVPMSALLFEGDGDALVTITTQVAARAGAIVRIESRSSEALHAGQGYDLAALLHEQSISTNTAAAGGNAQLMTMA
ncbi:MAG: bifunctional proline dehydrogenase/L-glutamate gamma-semialdehyde dehydrogenase PutA, partial [Comamonas sp.]|nr:bifunctional proline dehydrogenase/L-glutamate gamma-semialdehyde dehydrogenase PutA [Comamonas sp.]